MPLQVAALTETHKGGTDAYRLDNSSTSSPETWILNMNFHIQIPKGPIHPTCITVALSFVFVCLWTAHVNMQRWVCQTRHFPGTTIIQHKAPGATAVPDKISANMNLSWFLSPLPTLVIRGGLRRHMNDLYEEETASRKNEHHLFFSWIVNSRHVGNFPRGLSNAC